MSAIKIVLLSLMVWGVSWGNATNLDERPKKHMFVSGCYFQMNDFQEIYGISAEDTEIVGKEPAKENWCEQKKHLDDEKSAEGFSFKKPPHL